MSSPFSYAVTALEDSLHRLLGPVARHHVEDLARDTIETFLEDAKSEGRFDAVVIGQLLADLNPKLAAAPQSIPVDYRQAVARAMRKVLSGTYVPIDLADAAIVTLQALGWGKK